MWICANWLWVFKVLLPTASSGANTFCYNNNLRENGMEVPVGPDTVTNFTIKNGTLGNYAVADTCVTLRIIDLNGKLHLFGIFCLRGIIHV